MFRKEEYPIRIPTWKKGEWTETEFNSQEHFNDFLVSVFTEPGTCDFDNDVHEFNKESQVYKEKGYYCKAPFKSKDYRKYWDDQKNKCRKGVIYIGKKRSWFLSRDYYMWLNFLPIFDKEKNIYDFPEIWDVQYYMSLYEVLAELNNKHTVVLKKRQIASSYYHCAKLINQYWFEEGAKLKIGASLKDYINEKGSWKMVQEYSDFLNEHTAWVRAHNPHKVLDWEQKIQVTINGRDINKGLRSTISGMSFEKNATTGVGGPCKYFFHEEGGIAPRADQTYEYMRPALHSGMITTGMFIIAGSVGDLSQCEPLKEFVLNPEENDFYSVESDLINEKKVIGKHGLFLPEQWSMPPYIDKYGNSLVEEAVKAIDEQRLKWKEDLNPDKYQLRISQKPKNIAEAFAFRKESVFPLHLLNAQARRIEEKEYGYEFLDLHVSDEGVIETTKLRNHQ